MFVRIATWTFGVILLAIGIASWLARQPYGVQLTEIDALAELNAVIVGLHLAVGLAVVVFAVVRLDIAGLLVGTLAVAGLAIVRTTEMVAGDAATTRQWALLAPEIVGVIIGIALLIPRLHELRLLARHSTSGSRSQPSAPPTGLAE